MEERLQRLIEEKRNVFRGGIHLPEGGEFVQILVIQLRQHAGHTALQFPEIDAHAEPVQFPRPDRDPDLPVVAVRPFAVAGIGPEMVTAGKLAFNKDIHAFLSLCSCRACARYALNGKHVGHELSSLFFAFFAVAARAVSPMSACVQPAQVSPAAAGEVSQDRLFGGRLLLFQPRHGYRFSMDAVLLAHFVRPRPGWRILDLGCGCGVVGLIAAYRVPSCTVTLLERQPELARLAAANAAVNGMTDRVQAREADLRQLRTVIRPESFDLVLCNPPYYQQGRGRIRPDAQEASARHDLSAGVTDFVRAAAFGLRNRGRAVFIYRAASQAALQMALMSCRLAPKRVQMLYSYPGAVQARLFLVEALKNGGDACTVLPPFYLHAGPEGTYTAAMQRLYQEEACWPRP